ncbi:MAG TPA: alpha,alpha-trehalose-phosphate synthase (UDP-forming) [Candidatus Polarisedimenticolia bacterium]|nr:alpha,alpha-trehalose-phosphate synthase (UDP-forming) [Dongiaceae bacterium]HYV88559.1 alpha,alpha-trehalose-phosphate synthase (UDP-forming) [Candidatus Polarisedimenticolia bacterium]
MARLVVISNRVALPGDAAARAGGLAVALREALARQGGLWFGWSGETVEGETGDVRLQEDSRDNRIRYATIDLNTADYHEFYGGFANGVLWPLFHLRPGLSVYRRAAFEGYTRVNEAFARRLQPLLRPDDLIWVHDYHFIPLAAELRRLGVRNRIGFFLHIPFPPPELLVSLPVHKSLMADLLCYDLIGLQTADDVRSLARYIAEEVKGRLGGHGMVEALGQTSRVAAFPIGIDTARFAALAQSASERPEAERLRDSLVGRDLVIGVDRLDYSKGLPQRLEAFQHLLSQWPEHRSRATLLQISPVSRGEVAQYRQLRREVEGLAGRINGKFAEADWTPVRYLNRSFSRRVLAGYLRLARVGLVTPARDGMNLVAKEFVAAQDPADPGVLVLSRFAGAARELRDALIVNPFDVEEVATALHQALAMPREQRIARWRVLMDVISANTIDTWCESFLTALEEATPLARSMLRRA